MLTRACIELLKKADDAPVIFTTSDVARQGRAYWGAYSITGHAIEGMVEIWADELETNTPIRFNTIDPGPIRSGFRARLYPGELAKDQPSAETIVPAYLYLLVEQIAGIALKAQ
jgi:NAD(P)-dependent dehydrogenase (short-subunit alcohol dehydrogenase family)